MKNMIYFNKLIGICINRQESQKVVDNYFVGTKASFRRTNKKLNTSKVQENDCK